VAEVSLVLLGIEETWEPGGAPNVALARLTEERGRDIGIGFPDAAACDAAGIVLLPAGDLGSSSSSESESSLSELAPATDGLLLGESGLFGPFSSSSSGVPDAAGASKVLVVVDRR
jgi:hypothetical protein